MDPRYPDELLDLDESLKVSTSEQMVEFFSRIATAQSEQAKHSGQKHPMTAVWKLVESRLRKRTSASGAGGRRYTDAEWATVKAANNNILRLQRTLVELDLAKPAEDDVAATGDTTDYNDVGGNSLSFIQKDGHRNELAKPRGQKLPYGPSAAKSVIECPKGSSCYHHQKGTCFYRHGSKAGLLDWPSRAGGGGSKGGSKRHGGGSASEGNQLKPDTLYLIKECKDGKRRAFEQEPGGQSQVERQQAKKKVRFQTKKAGGKAGGKGILLGNVLMSLSMMAIAITGLFSPASAEGTFNQVGNETSSLTNTFHLACSISNETASRVTTPAR